MPKSTKYSRSNDVNIKGYKLLKDGHVEVSGQWDKGRHDALEQVLLPESSHFEGAQKPQNFRQCHYSLQLGALILPNNVDSNLGSRCYCASLEDFGLQRAQAEGQFGRTQAQGKLPHVQVQCWQTPRSRRLRGPKLLRVQLTNQKRRLSLQQ